MHTISDIKRAVNQSLDWEPDPETEGGWVAEVVSGDEGIARQLESDYIQAGFAASWTYDREAGKCWLYVA